MVPPKTTQEKVMNNEARELILTELDEVSGGGLVDFGLGPP